MGSADQVKQQKRRSGHLADWVIRTSTAGVVVGVAAVAAYVSYRHAYELVSAHGETAATARLVPLTVDGLVYASSMAMLDAARHKTPTPLLARWLLALGILATLAANVAHGVGNGPIGAIVAAWPAAALVGSYELLMALVRGGVRRGTAQNDARPATEPLTTSAAETGHEIPADLTLPPEIEYDQHAEHDQQNEENDHEEDKQLTQARETAQEYWDAHQRWIPRDELRKRMRCSSKRATELLREIKDADSIERR